MPQFRAPAALCAMLLAIGSIGCGNADRGAMVVGPTSSNPTTLASPGSSIPSVISALTGQVAVAPPPTTVERKIIYEAHMTLTVEEFSACEQQLATAVAEHGGYISQSGFSGRTLGQRHGTWTIRVPADEYRRLLAALDGVGELQKRTETSREVTAEYVDLQARIANKNREEQRLLALLDTHSGKLEDVLNVERELSRVREEIERMQGQLRLLENQTALSTIHLTVEERQPFVPPETPSFATLAGRTWTNSVGLLLAFARSLTLVTIGLAPWAILAVPTILVVTLLTRRSRPRAVPANVGGGR